VRVGLSAVVVMVLAGFLGPLAPPAAAETRLDVTAGYGGYHVPGRALPVQVTVTAERLVNGELAVVTGDGKKPVTSLPVEVAGGSVKRFTLVVPGGVTAASGAVEVELRTGGRALGRGKADVRAAEDSELVGLGPRLVEGRPLPGPAPLAAETGVARFAVLDAGLLTQAPASLEPLSTIGLASGELAGLSPDDRAGLLRWVEAGGHLLIDERVGTTVDGLPATWQPGPTGRSAAGTTGAGGEVRLTGDALTAGRWDKLIEPTSTGRADGAQFGSPESVANSLAGDAGLRLPRLSWLLGFLGAYILVVGPMTAIVLRRRRRQDLAWVAVPALAVVFTALAYVAGNQLRPGAGLAHGTILETGDAGPVATSWVALTRRTAGTARVDLPEGWTVDGALNGNFGGNVMRSSGGLDAPSVGAGARGPQARLPLASGEFGVFKASGPATVQGRLEVTAASSGDGQAGGTVRNGMPFAVDEVVVFVGYHRARVGRLAPGEQKNWAVTTADRVLDPGGSEAWLSNFNGFRPDGLVNLSLWQSSLTDLGVDGDPPAAAMAVGWTDDWKPVLTVDGKGRPAPGRTAVVGRAPVTVTGGHLTDLAVATDVVRGPSLNPFGAKFAGAGGAGVAAEPSIVKLTLPAGIDLAAAAPAGKAGAAAAERAAKLRGELVSGPLALRTSLPLTDVAVWHNGAWQHLPVPFGFGGINGMIRFKQGMAIRGGGGFVIDAPAPAMPPPTMPVVPMPDASMPVPTTVPAMAPPPGLAVPMPMPVPPGGGAIAANNLFDIPLPAGIGTDGVIFLRLVLDPTNMTGDAVLNLVEARS
jgi:hypothetical protein